MVDHLSYSRPIKGVNFTIFSVAVRGFYDDAKLLIREFSGDVQVEAQAGPGRRFIRPPGPGGPRIQATNPKKRANNNEIHII